MKTSKSQPKKGSGSLKRQSTGQPRKIGVRQLGCLPKISPTNTATETRPSISTSMPHGKTSSAESQDVAMQLEALQSLWIRSLPDYCRDVLTIRSKAGTLEPFTLNRAQLHFHRMLEEQLAKTGMVRAIVLKGRQQGISTYTQARYYWRTSLGAGKRAYILTHRQEATENIFDIAERFHREADPMLRPHLGVSNAKELFFSKLDSGYKVATAGASGTGRSGTAQLFHGSEVAFWPNAADHMAGVGQIIADQPGTEIILESTANGIGNVFHSLWQKAERGESSYIACFLPWFWQPEYVRSVPPGFHLEPEEQAYQSAHGLTLEQVAWRRAKIIDDFSGDVLRFRQEYPATPAEAFVAVGHDSFISTGLVAAARGRRIEAQNSGLVVGVDPARFGDNSSVIARRRGRQAMQLETMDRRDTMHQAGRLALLIREEKPMRLFIDVGGLGAGIYDRLIELGYGDVVTGVNFGGDASKPDRYGNKRAEMWGDLRDWLPLASLPDDDVLQGEISGPSYRYDSQGAVWLEKKEDMRKRGVKSPDRADALALTFAMPIAHLSAAAPGGRAWEDMIDALHSASGSGMDCIEGIHTG